MRIERKHGGVLLLAMLGAAAGCARKGAVFELKGPFAEPESVLYEPRADVYLVSNVAGSPLERDGNGFIGRISPDGKIIAARWIEGGARGAVLDAPKGMAIAGDALFVADIDKVRMFTLSDGAARQAVTVAGAKFLNDVISINSDEVLVSDMLTNRIHRVSNRGVVTLFAEDAMFGAANGLAIDSERERIFVLSGDADRVSVLDTEGKLLERMKLSASKLDGIVVTRKHQIYVSSWANEAVYEIDATKQAKLVFGKLTSPADIGWDSKRERLLVPLMQRSELVVFATSEKAP